MTTIDPVTAEVLRHMLISIPDQIDTNIARTAFTPLVYDYKDFAVGLLDARGRLIAQGGGGAPIFVANALTTAVLDGLAVLGAEGMRPGDIIISNHAKTLGQHLNNVAMFMPVFHEDTDGVSVLAGFIAVMMHWIDIGGMRPGSASVEARSIYQEGVQFRALKICSGGKPVPGVLATIEANTRFPRALMGDIDAQIGGCLRGQALLLELIERYGFDAYLQALEHLLSCSDAAARSVVRALPDGHWRASSMLDNDGIALDVPLPVNVAVTIAGEHVTIDFTGTAQQVMAPINSGRDGGAVTAARIAYKMLATPGEPVNEGAFRSLEVIVPDGTIISAVDDAPLGHYSTILPTVVDTVLKAFTDAAPERIGGGHHGSFSSLTFTGIHPDTGDLFQSLDTGHGGWGAFSDCDGPGPYKTMVHGDTFGLSIEACEAFYPVRVHAYELRPDSGGAGQFRGGDGTRRIVEILAPLEILVLMERTECPAWGAMDGNDGKPGACYVDRVDQPRVQLRKGILGVGPGDRVELLCGGGGGWGDPNKRDRDRVRKDVREGRVSAEMAMRVYGWDDTKSHSRDAKVGASRALQSD